MNVFERYLTVWVFLCIVIGIALGEVSPGAFQAIGAMSIAQVNLPVGLLIWVMIIPMLMKVDFGALGQVRRHVRGIARRLDPGGDLFLTHRPNVAASSAVAMASRQWDFVLGRQRDVSAETFFPAAAPELTAFTAWR